MLKKRKRVKKQVQDNILQNQTWQYRSEIL